MSIYDIIIVGGGIGGSMATLHSTGKVILIEKKKKIGYPPKCGEGLIGKAINSFNLEEHVKDANKFHKMEFNFPNGRQKILKFHLHEGYVINKDKFIQGILHEAVKKDDISLTVRTNTIADYADGKIILNENEEVTGKIIIAADGIFSNIGRKTGMTSPLKPEDVHTCAQYTLKGYFDSDAIKIFLGEPYAPNGYAWIFPKSTKIANVGLGIQGSLHLNVKEQLDWFINDYYSEATKGNFFTAPVCLAQPAKQCVKDNIILVGDAARFTQACSGGGIANALLSGKTAGEVASKYLKGETNLNTYQHLMYTQLYPKLIRAYKFKQKIMKDGGMDKFYRMVTWVLYFHKIFPKFIEEHAFSKIRF